MQRSKKYIEDEKLCDHIEDIFKRTADDSDFDTSIRKSEKSEYKETWLDSDRDYTYSELLARLYHLKDNSDCNEKFMITKPILGRDGGKRIVIQNFSKICSNFNRDKKHVETFIQKEYMVKTNISENSLSIKGNFGLKQIEAILRKYVLTYVLCKTCKSSKTHLQKRDRLHFIVCSSCKSEISVLKL